MPIFTPPVVQERMPASAGRLFSFYTQPQGHAVVWRNGHFVQVRVPSQEETAALVEGVTWFTGGRTYDVSADTATLLNADGFTTTTSVGPFGGL